MIYVIKVTLNNLLKDIQDSININVKIIDLVPFCGYL